MASSQRRPAVTNIVIVGLGYVGAPLAVALAAHYRVTGYDIDEQRVGQLQGAIDCTDEMDPQALQRSTAQWTTSPACIADAEVVIVTVPTPVDPFRVPDLSAVRAATATIGQWMRKGAVVVYESTVYPGVTQDICAPLLAHTSGLNYPGDFHVGYSPERINPGDRVHTLTTTTKIVAADSPQVRDLLARIYGRITQVYKAQTIKVAEAAKVLENTQRDVNIALMNELSQIFSPLGIDTTDVIDAARSKWNFMDFRPGLVGGHCISVDPYYLSHKAASHGIVADVILSARQINESMAAFVADQLLQRMVRHQLLRSDTVITILGATFKEDVRDVRNSGAITIYHQLAALGIAVQLIDPLVDGEALKQAEGIHIIELPHARPADAIVLAVPHAAFRQQGWQLVRRLSRDDQSIVVADVKATLPREDRPEHVVHWRP
ncbi:MAG: nucleotide sugar dehydrogenase [Comamonadaceae bacterium]|nr:MAG: nucleotide sugar dehydrogenase [Comamonadaceae bacterium]